MKTLAKQILPSSVWNALYHARTLVASPKRVQKYMDLVGFTVADKSDYYSPLTPVAELRASFGRWSRPSALKGIRYDLDRVKADFADLLSEYLAEFSRFAPYAELQKLGYGPGFTAVDALTLYMMIRRMKPARYIEVGSGLSTYYCSLAARQNAAEGRPVAITCIEPHPYDKLRSIPDIQLVIKEVQDVDPARFESLQAGDVLFIDSSHVVRIDGDVPFLFLEVLPRLNPGVIVHIHDVPFPFNTPYPPELWVFGQPWPMRWTEAMVVQAFLCFNEQFRIIMSTPLIRHFDEAFLAERIPFYESVAQNPNTFSSLWLRRTA